jgi:hypothetical protein
VTLNNSMPADGNFGLGSNRAHSRFSFFRIEVCEE